MANQSDSPPVSDNNNTQNSASQATLPTTDNLKETNDDPSGQGSPPSVFINSEPIREDQVLNAVRFLSHPNVRGSAVMHRRSFLEKKGLTREEIDEAFRRVPDPSPSATFSQPRTINQGPTQAVQPAPLAASGAISKVTRLSGFRWFHAIALMGASGAGIAVLFKKSIIPRFKSWIRKVVIEDDDGVKVLMLNTAEKAIAAANAAAAAVTDLSRTNQENMISRREEWRYFEEVKDIIGSQLQEMKSINRAFIKFEGQANPNGRMMVVGQDAPVVTNLRQSYAYGKPDNDIIPGVPGISSAPVTFVQPSAASHPKAYTEIMSMVQRGERPSNIREINDQPPYPNQPIPIARIHPRPKPWEVAQTVGYGSDSRIRGDVSLGEGSATAPWSQNNGMTSTETENGGSAVAVERTMLQRGWVPPQPSNKFAIAEAAEGSTTAPWSQNNGTTAPWSQNNGMTSTPTENGGSAVVVERTMQQRAWIPPQPPKLAMAEAAEAIWQQKNSTIERQMQVMHNDEAGGPSGISDELQEITQFSESGGVGGIEAKPVGGESPAAVPQNTAEIENMEI